MNMHINVWLLFTEIEYIKVSATENNLKTFRLLHSMQLLAFLKMPKEDLRIQCCFLSHLLQQTVPEVWLCIFSKNISFAEIHQIKPTLMEKIKLKLQDSIPGTVWVAGQDMCRNGTPLKQSPGSEERSLCPPSEQTSLLAITFKQHRCFSLHLPIFTSLVMGFMNAQRQGNILVWGTCHDSFMKESQISYFM